MWFHVLPDLHAKVTLVDETDIVVGSANLTGAGMSLVPASNREFGLVAQATPQDVLACQGLLADAVQITPELLEEISAWVTANKVRKPSAVPSFPDEIRQQLEVVPSRLFTAELPWLPGPSLLREIVAPTTGETPDSLRHDLALLGLERSYATEIAATAAVTTALRSSRFWKWLTCSIRAQPNMEVWFGNLTAMLHTALCDDPRPYRQDVKVLVSNLYSYADAFGCGLKADRPNWSQRLSIADGQTSA